VSARCDAPCCTTCPTPHQLCGAPRRRGAQAEKWCPSGRPVDLPLCIPAFVVAVAGFSAGVSTLIVRIGLPILVLTLRACRGLAEAERRATEWATGRPLPPHHYREPTGRGIAKPISSLAEPQSWRDLLYAVAAFPVRLATFVIVVAWTVGGVAALLSVTWKWALPEGDVGFVHAHHRLRVVARGRRAAVRDGAAHGAHHAARGAGARPGPCRARAGPAHQPERGAARPRHPAGDEQARRGAGRGADAAAARARHPRRPAAAARPAQHGSRGRRPAPRRRSGAHPRRHPGSRSRSTFRRSSPSSVCRRRATTIGG
jgi:hypothetical protein